MSVLDGSVILDSLMFKVFSLFFYFWLLIDWLIDWSIDRLIDGLIDWLIDFIDWLIGWLVDWLVYMFMHLFNYCKYFYVPWNQAPKQ